MASFQTPFTNSTKTLERSRTAVLSYPTEVKLDLVDQVRHYTEDEGGPQIKRCWVSMLRRPESVTVSDKKECSGKSDYYRDQNSHVVFLALSNALDVSITKDITIC